MSAKSELPQELVDLIIDHCHADSSTLIACSLVCKAWLPSSQRNLFSDLCLERARIERRLLLNGPPPLHYTRRLLVLSDGYSPPAVNDILCRNPPLPITSLFLHCITGIDISGTSVTWATSFLSLTSLEFLDITTSISRIIEVLCAFPCLESLSLRGWFLDYSETMQPTRLRLSNKLKVCNISFPRFSGFLDWMVTQGHIPITTLRLVGIWYEDGPIIQRMLEVSGDTIQTLCFNANRDGGFARSINLAASPRLRCLELSGQHWDTMFPCLLSTLDPASPLLDIIIAICPDDFRRVDHKVYWGGLDLSPVKRLTVNVIPADDTVQQEIEHTMKVKGGLGLRDINLNVECFTSVRSRLESKVGQLRMIDRRAWGPMLEL